MNFDEEEYSGKHVPHLFRRLFAYALKYKKLVAIVIGTMVLQALTDISFPLFSRYAIDNFVIKDTTDGIVGYAIAFLFLIALSSFLVIMFISHAGKLEMYISYTIRKEAFVKLEELSFSYYDTTPVGYIMARMISDIARLSETVAWGLVDLMWSVVYIAGTVVTMFVLNARLALIVLSVFVPLSVVSYFFQKAILKHQRRVRKVNSTITAGFNEGIMGAVTTKILVREQKNAEEFFEKTANMRRASLKSARLSALFIPIVMVLGSIGTALALWQGGSIAAIGGIGIGTLATFVSYSTGMFDPIQNLARIIVEFQGAKASAERVISLIDEQCEITDSPEVVEKFGTAFDPITENWPSIKGDIEFKDVGFSYKNSDPILEHFNLTVKAGENVAIVGETGAGKSTIVNLVCRFYEPVSGEILIDGVDYRERSMLWLQKSLGYVLQTPHLFSGTIAQNIAYSRPDASIEDIRDAAKTVSAHDFIEKLEKGYDTQVGEGGALLSTGQKQLISFARVILANPRIFVLDEATSAVDAETEQLIQNAITAVLDNRTSFIIAHRLSTIRNADTILVIDDGKIAESGSHEQLIAKNGKYKKLYDMQLKTQREREILE